VANSTLESSEAEAEVSSEREDASVEIASAEVEENARSEDEASCDTTIPGRTAPSAGTLLREAREARELSREDLARTLNLHVRIIEALERDDDSQLPGPAFVRGYLRSYARLMGLDSEPLLADHQARTGGVVPEVHASPRLEREDAQPGVVQQNPGLVMAIATIALVMVVLAVLLIQRPEIFGDLFSAAPEASPNETVAAPRRSVEPATRRSDSASVAVDDARDGRSVATAPVRVDGDATEAAPVVEPESAVESDGADASGEDVASVGAFVDAAEAARETASAAPSTASATARATDLPSTSAIATTGTETSEIAIENDLFAQPDADGIVRIRSVDGRNLRVLAGGEEHLLFAFEGECWVHVRDADGQSVYQDLNRSGETVELWGRAPFRIRLGYAPAVSLTYNGSRVALRPFTRNDVANLTLGR